MLAFLRLKIENKLDIVFSQFNINWATMTDVNSDESKGALETRPPSPIFFFNFMQILGENGKKIKGYAPPCGVGPKSWICHW